MWNRTDIDLASHFCTVSQWHPCLIWAFLPGVLAACRIVSHALNESWVHSRSFVLVFGDGWCVVLGLVVVFQITLNCLKRPITNKNINLLIKSSCCFLNMSSSNTSCAVYFCFVWGIWVKLMATTLSLLQHTGDQAKATWHLCTALIQISIK